MKKLFAVFILLVCSLSFGQIKNWKGYLDTNIVWLNNTTTKKYSKVYDLSDAVANGVVMMVNDTNVAGLTSDLTKLCYGLQVGVPVINGSGNLDTAWGAYDTLDTISTAGHHALKAGGRYSIETDLITEDMGLSDTSQVTGYAVQMRPLRPYNWAPLMRIWCVGQTGISTSTANKVVIQVYRMNGVPTISK
jgi:hypothetical protein